jgi:hypothetical protein
VTLKDLISVATLIFAQDKLLGVNLVADAASTEWFDPRVKRCGPQSTKLLPQTVNRLEIGARSSTAWVLVNAKSDRVPVSFLLFNTTDKTLTRVRESRPESKADQMNTRQFVRYKARDELEIPAG